MASLLEETRRLGHLVDDLHTLVLAETGRLVLQQEAVAVDGPAAGRAAKLVQLVQIRPLDDDAMAFR